MHGFVAGWRAAWRWLRVGADRGGWVVPGQVWACPYPRTDAALTALAQRGVRCVINLHDTGHDAACLARYGLIEGHFPTPDFCPPAPEALDAAVALVAQEVAAGRVVAVHCGGGLGRTGTVVACYLLRVHPEWQAAEAIAAVRAARPGSIETGSQERAVCAFAARLAETR